ncbi:MAG: signal peptidase I [Planctomycetota bacterium]
MSEAGPVEASPVGSNAAGAEQPGIVDSLVIAVIVALLVKAFVLEAFVIPTGSMAPTLLGQHIRFHSPQTGANWAVAPWHYADSSRQLPRPVQGRVVRNGEVVRADDNPRSDDPVTTPGPHRDLGFEVGGDRPMPLRAGDRILIAKAAYALRDPQRYEVAVFKNPTSVQQNFIKRIVGVPGEQVWLVDGDVYTRPAPQGDGADAPIRGAADEGWAIRRKPAGVQRAVWRTVFSSEFTPLDVIGDVSPAWWRCPWVGDGWDTSARAYTFAGDGPAELRWDIDWWPMTDWEPYNDVPGRRYRRDPFPVSDVRVRAGIEPLGDGPLRVELQLETRGMTFSARLAREPDGHVTASLAHELHDLHDSPSAPMVDTEPSSSVLRPGVITNVTFEHVDQQVRLVVNGETLATHQYELAPADRITAVTGLDDPMTALLDDPGAYVRSAPRLTWRFDAGPLRLHRVGVDRDLYYRPEGDRGVHPDRVVTLGGDDFFALGDNSANSEDGRDWRRVDPAVESAFDPELGVVPRRLLLGRALFVYFPSPVTRGPIPVPDFGRMRAIK